MYFAPSKDTRKQLIDSVVATFEQRFYDPRLHGVPLRALVEKHDSELLRTDAFSQRMNDLLSALKAYPIEFFHHSERKLALGKAIAATFFGTTGNGFFKTCSRAAGPTGLASSWEHYC